MISLVILFQSTLPRRERRSYRAFHPLWCYFNPRSREGSDLWSFHDTIRPAIFQSTLPRRERRTHAVYSSSFSAFQSTLPRGERLDYFIENSPRVYISIHAPARGATLKPEPERPAKSISIHAPARGATYREKNQTTDLFISIHAPARGATYQVIVEIY